MEIKVNTTDTGVVVVPEGKLTVQTAPELEAAIDAAPEEVCNLTIDLSEVDYVSSAGLRVFVATDKLAVKRGGTFTLLHPCADVYDVLEMTGLVDIFTIER